MNHHNWRNGLVAELTALLLPTFIALEHILDGGIYLKESAPSSGWSLNFTSDVLLTLETDGFGATGIQ